METIAQPDMRKEDDLNARVAFRCSREEKRALKLRAVVEETTIEDQCRTALRKYLGLAAAA